MDSVTISDTAGGTFVSEYYTGIRSPFTLGPMYHSILLHFTSNEGITNTGFWFDYVVANGEMGDILLIYLFLFFLQQRDMYYNLAMIKVCNT